jgi:signal transduction histidine kinase
VRAFGGTITVESAPLGGSVFYVLLPVVDAPASAAVI